MARGLKYDKNGHDKARQDQAGHDETDARDFGGAAGQYRDARPSWPSAWICGLIDTLIPPCPGLADQSATVVEVGAGSGQATSALARRFETVVATDLSLRMLAQHRGRVSLQHSGGAPDHAPGDVLTVTCRAECTPLRDASVTGVFAFQAAHWFDAPRFSHEATRILRPGGVVVLAGYAPPMLDDATLDATLQALHDEILASHWPAERRHVVTRYRHLNDWSPPVWDPLDLGPNVARADPNHAQADSDHADGLRSRPADGRLDTLAADGAIERDWTPQAVAAYLETWSGVRAARETGDRRVDDALSAIATAPRNRLRIRWPLFARAWRRTAASTRRPT